MGAGRVNANRALTDIDPQQPKIKILLAKFTVDDSLFGNNNHLIDSDETIAVYIQLSNLSLGNNNSLQTKLVASNYPDLSWQTQTITVMAPADSDFSVPEPFIFTTPVDFDTEFLKFEIQYSGPDVLARFDTTTIQVGRYPILIVDDDDGVNNVDRFYRNPLAEVNVPFAHWDYSKLGSPDPEYLKQFPIVIWLCEWTFPSLTENDQNTVIEYLAEGGNLFISGQDIGWDLMDPASDNTSEAARDFYTTVLRANYLSDNADENGVTGIPGDRISEDLKFNIYQPGITADNQYPEVIEPSDSAKAVFYYDNFKGIGGISFNGDYRLVYLGFGLEAVNGNYYLSPDQLDPTRSQVLYRIINFLHPLRHEPVTDQLIPTDFKPVETVFTGPGLPPRAVNLLYKLLGDTSFISLPLDQNGLLYSGDLPLNNITGTVNYYFEIIDENYVWNLPMEGKNGPFIFNIGDDLIPPSIYHNSPGSRLTLNPDYQFSAIIRDNSELDSSALFLYYSSGGGEIDSSLMIYQSVTDLFSGNVLTEINYGDTLLYWFQGRDTAIPANYSITDTFKLVIGLEKFETGLGEWLVSGSGWGLDSTDVHSGTFSLATRPYGNYLNNWDIRIFTRDPVDLRNVVNAEFQFYSYFTIDNGDAGYVEIKISDNNWQKIAGPFSGFQPNWELVRINLAPFIGNEKCTFRFRFLSDGNPNFSLKGWMIDDVRIVQDDYISPVLGENELIVPQTFILSQGFPNPFRKKISFILNNHSDKKISISVFNLLGQKVRIISFQKYQHSIHQICCDTTDDYGNTLSAGIYLLKSQSPDQTLIKKMILLH